jgi:hypothetical protein
MSKVGETYREKRDPFYDGTRGHKQRPVVVLWDEVEDERCRRKNRDKRKK